MRILNTLSLVSKPYNNLVTLLLLLFPSALLSIPGNIFGSAFLPSRIGLVLELVLET